MTRVEIGYNFHSKYIKNSQNILYPEQRISNLTINLIWNLA